MKSMDNIGINNYELVNNNLFDKLHYMKYSISNDVNTLAKFTLNIKLFGEIGICMLHIVNLNLKKEING